MSHLEAAWTDTQQSTSPSSSEAIERVFNANQADHLQDSIRAEHYVQQQPLHIPAHQQLIDVSFQPIPAYRYPSPEQAQPRCYYAEHPSTRCDCGLKEHDLTEAEHSLTRVNSRRSTINWVREAFAPLPVFNVAGDDFVVCPRRAAQAAPRSVTRPGSSQTSHDQSQSEKKRNKRADKKFCCPHKECSKSFASRPSLKYATLPAQILERHALTESNRKHKRCHVKQEDRPHPCQSENCNRRFTYPKDLRKHQLTHEPNHNQRFFCTHKDCPAAKTPIIRLDNFKRHMRVQHEEPAVSEQISAGETTSWTLVQEMSETMSRE